MDSTDPDFFNPRPSDYDHKAGNGTWRSLRNAFPLETVRGVYEAQRKESSDKRVFIMTRSSFAGQQHYGSNMWSGALLRRRIPPEHAISAYRKRLVVAPVHAATIVA